MKYVNIFIGILLCCFVSEVNAFNTLGDTLAIENKNDPKDKDWPDCISPQNLSLSIEEDYQVVTWDNSEKQSEFEVKFVSSDRKSVMQEKTVMTNYIAIDKKMVSDESVSYIKVRRKCKDQNANTIFSDWEVLKMGGGSQCDCEDLYANLPKPMYQVYGTCLLVEFDKYPCETANPNYEYVVTVDAEAPEYPRTYMLSALTTFQDQLPEGVVPTSVTYQYRIAGRFCKEEFDVPNVEFEIDENVFDLSNCGIGNPCDIPSFLKAELVKDKVKLTIDGISQSEFDIKMAGIGSAELFIEAGEGEDYKYVVLPFYNGSWFDVDLYEEMLSGFDGFSKIKVQLIYLFNDKYITCDEVYEIAIDSNSDYCSILELLLDVKVDPDMLNLNFNDPNDPSYYAKAIGALGYKNDDVNKLFSDNLIQIKFTLLSTNETIKIDPVKEGPISDLDIWFGKIDFVADYTSQVVVEYVFKDYSSQSCVLPIGPYNATVQNELPDYTCGQDYVVPDISNQTPLDKLNVGDLIFMSGMAIIVKSVSGSNGSYSGDGILANPFTQDNILVTFNGLSVNENYNAYTGTVDGVMGDPLDFPDFYVEPDTFNIGGDICLPPPPPPGYDEGGFDDVTGLNDRGFNADGFHPGTNSKYDPNGFDIDGNHKDTEGPYDEDGCDMYGYDENGVLCEKDDSVITEFIDSISTTLGPDITLIVDDLLDSLNTSIATNDCSELRTDINTLIANLGFQREYIVGEGDKYLKQGMSEEFSSEPHQLVLQTVRDENVILLEQKHVELYHCDKIYLRVASLLEGLESVSADEIILKVKEELNSLTHFQVSEFKKDPSKFNDWIILAIERILNNDYGIGHNDIPDVPFINQNFKVQSTNSVYSSVASNGDANFRTSHSQLEEQSWLLRQGKQSINGLDRGLYLEELFNQMAVMGGEEEDGVALPVRIRKIVDQLPYDIYIDNLKITPNGGTVSATFIFTEPNSGKKIIFKAHDISFGTGGTTGESKLSLETVVEMRLSNAALLRLNADQGTYVTWDCTGFTGMGVNADIELCRNLVVPLNSSTYQPLPDPERFGVNFKAQIDSWSDIYLSIQEGETTPFALADYPDMIWTVSDLIFDFSDKESPMDITLHPEYASPHFTVEDGLNQLWKGVYLGQLEVRMSTEFSADGSPLIISVNDVVIDDTGVSGVLKADNVLPYEKGSMSGWQFSVDKIEISVLQNHIREGSMGGKISVPVLKNPMDYDAFIYPGSTYEFTVHPNLQDSMDLFLATVSLDDNSKIEVKYEEDEFTAKAILFGQISVDKEVAGVELKYDDIKFEEFEISNKAPYFSPGKWHFPNDIGASLLGFGINLKDITPFKSEEDEKEVGLATIVDLTLAGEVGISATGALEIIGNLHEDSKGRQKWKFDHVNVTEFGVDVEFSAGHIKGAIQRFKNEGIYGNGFQGFLDAKFKGLGQMTAMGLFGNVGQDDDNYKYFFVDALVNISGIGIPAGPLSINGFAGGVSYHMDRDYSVSNLNNSVNTTSLPNIGTSFSGTKYTPNKARALGLKAGALISTTGTKSLFNGIVSLGILFNATNPDGSGGGVEEFTFNGTGQFLSLSDIAGPDVDADQNAKPKVNSVLSAYIDITYNFSQNVFDGKFGVFMNTPGGIIKGTMNDAGKMVDASAYFSPDKWYVYLGTPTTPCGIGVYLPLVGTAEFKTYMDVGTDVPNMPNLPQTVREIAYKVKKNQTLRNTGAGFVFGASFDVHAEIDAGIASGELDAGLGFDLMVRNFPGAYCLGDSPSDEIGFNGWYAMGQMWAYLEGSVKILGFNVLSAGVAAVLQAQLPNPTFAQATVGVRVKVLFGTVKKSFKVAIGDACNIVSSSDESELGMKVISFMDPVSGAQELETDVEVRAVLALPLNKKMQLPTISNPDVFHNYEVKLDSVTLNGNYGSYKVDPRFNDDKTEVFFENNDLFYSNDSITATIYVTVFKNGTKLESESDTTIFKVGKGYNNIPKSNVEFTYPVDGMHNFYKNEYNQNKGFVQLKQGMPEFFYDVEEGLVPQIRMTNTDGQVLIFDIDYDPIRRRVEYKFDPSLIDNNKVYKFEIVQIAEGTFENNTPENGWNSPISTFMGFDGKNSSQGLGQSVANESVTERVLYNYYFRTSLYNSFKEKLDNVLDEQDSGAIPVINETFDPIELQGGDYGKPLANFEINTSGSWFDQLKSKLYSKPFPVKNITLKATQTGSTYSQVCFGDLQIGNNLNKFENLKYGAGMQFKYMRFIDKDEFNSKYVYDYGTPGVKATQKVLYNIQKLVRKDWFAVRNSINACLNDSDLFLDWEDSTGTNPPDDLNQVKVEPSYLEHIRKNNIPSLPNGQYKVNARYVLPGNIPTSSYPILFTHD